MAAERAAAHVVEVGLDVPGALLVHDVRLAVKDDLIVEQRASVKSLNQTLRCPRVARCAVVRERRAAAVLIKHHAARAIDPAVRGARGEERMSAHPRLFMPGNSRSSIASLIAD